jgi:hypothetical protein
MTKMEAGSRASAQWQIHHAGTSWAVALAHSVWIPLAVAFFGAAGGGLISAWAIFRNGSKEWQRKQAEAREALQQKKAQARRALQIEMLMNAQRLRIATIVVARSASKVSEAPQETPWKLRNLLAGRDFDATFGAYFIDAAEGIAWKDASCVLEAYSIGEVLFEGSLVLDPIGRGEELYSGNADNFCKAIRAMSKYDKLEDSFYEEVEKLEKWLLRHNPQKGLPADSQP